MLNELFCGYSFSFFCETLLACILVICQGKSWFSNLLHLGAIDIIIIGRHFERNVISAFVVLFPIWIGSFELDHYSYISSYMNNPNKSYSWMFINNSKCKDILTSILGYSFYHQIWNFVVYIRCAQIFVYTQWIHIINTQWTLNHKTLSI